MEARVERGFGWVRRFGPRGPPTQSIATDVAPTKNKTRARGKRTVRGRAERPEGTDPWEHALNAGLGGFGGSGLAALLHEHRDSRRSYERQKCASRKWTFRGRAERPEGTDAWEHVLNASLGGFGGSGLAALEQHRD